ncbi:DMT family transporter [Agrobacterium tumefaciens]|uniref:DMT family transporter n=1 Tax=Agrobacterium tumefaciens TaxID=358 RepID=UPI0015729053|nr:DMT family transporter [Agrobacterium tumefaciens]NTB97268.1 DMT family transporter [Agrobacterium tumefaciens]NTC45170.1 DMT family transporter [Agrobacterium tumefaciens]
MSDHRNASCVAAGQVGAEGIRGVRISKADLQLCAATLLAGSGWHFSMKALVALPPLLFMGSRFVIAGALIAILTDLGNLRRASHQCLPLVISAFAMALSMTGWILALKHTTHAGVAAFISATGNLMVPLVGALLFRWPLSRSLLLSLPLALVGLSLLFLDAHSSFDTSHLLFTGSAFLWACSVALIRNANPSLGTAMVTSFQLIIAGVLMLLASYFFEEMPQALPPSTVWIWFLASVLLSTCLRFALQYQGMRQAPPGRAAILLSFEPVWTMALSILVLGAAISWMQALGCAVVFAVISNDLRSNSPTRDHKRTPHAAGGPDLREFSKERLNG